jgi:hypothetical protein
LALIWHLPFVVSRNAFIAFGTIGKPLKGRRKILVDEMSFG